MTTPDKGSYVTCEYGAICTPEDPCGLHEAQGAGREQVCSNPNCHLWPKPHPLTLSCPPKPGREQAALVELIDAETLIAEAITEAREQAPGGVPVERLRALVRLLGPDQITPTAKRMIEAVCKEHDRD